ncbi:CHAP domain-containing protein [Actinomadura bangladeshensis]|uniref:CHAP domain-containing protein n=1 Tax=Actinomadura bangladeshensis TaxID=453573 RepID=A0A4R4NSF2_9ACTN|nr:CHAP domain-containing protein [Actinomadura bangladeshensis]TDC12289.1 CHAP domain-containing protein [Actinomadura bangladeshensis]
MPGTHRKKVPGKHRKPGSLSITWRTTGGVIVGAAVLGTAAATAQASVLPFGPAPATATAAGVTTAGKAGKAPAKDASKGSSKGTSKGGSDATSKAAPKKAEPRKAAPAATGASRPTAAEAIKIAKSQVGVTEDGGGETKFQKWYMSTARAKETVARDGGSIGGYSDAQWCDMFVSWVGEQIGFTDQVGSDAWTVAHAEWFQEHGRWGTEPRPGAIVFYAWNGSKKVSAIRHVGMVVDKVDDGTIEAVEGNTGNAVKIKKRSTDDIVGYGYPDYKS